MLKKPRKPKKYWMRMPPAEVSCAMAKKWMPLILSKMHYPYLQEFPDFWGDYNLCLVKRQGKRFNRKTNLLTILIKMANTVAKNYIDKRLYYKRIINERAESYEQMIAEESIDEPLDEPEKEYTIPPTMSHEELAFFRYIGEHGVFHTNEYLNRVDKKRHRQRLEFIVARLQEDNRLGKPHKKGMINFINQVYPHIKNINNI